MSNPYRTAPSAQTPTSWLAAFLKASKCCLGLHEDVMVAYLLGKSGAGDLYTYRCVNCGKEYQERS